MRTASGLCCTDSFLAFPAFSIILISQWYVGVRTHQSCPQTTPSMQALREGLVSYVDFLRLGAISLHKNRRLESDWSLVNKYVILTHHDV